MHELEQIKARAELKELIKHALLASAPSDKYGLDAETEALLEAIPVADALLAAGYGKTDRLVAALEAVESQLRWLDAAEAVKPGSKVSARVVAEHMRKAIAEALGEEA